jgi:hypothetical protein
VAPNGGRYATIPTILVYPTLLDHHVVQLGFTSPTPLAFLGHQTSAGHRSAGSTHTARAQLSTMLSVRSSLAVTEKFPRLVLAPTDPTSFHWGQPRAMSSLDVAPNGDIWPYIRLDLILPFLIERSLAPQKSPDILMSLRHPPSADHPSPSIPTSMSLFCQWSLTLLRQCSPRLHHIIHYTPMSPSLPY